MGSSSASASSVTSSLASSLDDSSANSGADVVGNASSESLRSGMVWTDSAPSARGTGWSPSSTRLSESERRLRSPSISRIRTLTASPCETTSRILDVVRRELRDVHEPLDAREDLDEGAEGDDLRDASLDDVVLA